MDGQPGEGDLRPTTASRQALDWLGQYGDDELDQQLTAMAAQVRKLVPTCVAMSVSVTEDDLTFTLMADRPGAGYLDAMQYLSDGPCLLAVRDGSVTATSDLPTDEGRWQLFARAEALTGIASTLSLPMMRGGRAIGSVNLYASTSDAFDGHHGELAEICGAWAGGAVTNADLSFTSRLRAAATPERLRERGAIDIAAGYVAAQQRIAISEAASRIDAAATAAGVSVADFARFILDAHNDDSGSNPDAVGATADASVSDSGDADGRISGGG